MQTAVRPLLEYRLHQRIGRIAKGIVARGHRHSEVALDRLGTVRAKQRQLLGADDLGRAITGSPRQAPRRPMLQQVAQAPRGGIGQDRPDPGAAGAGEDVCRGGNVDAR